MTALHPGTEAALLHRLATGQRDGRTPSVVAGLVRDGELVWCAGRGRVAGAVPDADTQYRIGSITKTFVAVLVMRLRDDGRLDLADPIEQYLPDTELRGSTIAQLLSHTAGLAAETPPPWWERSDGSARPALADALGTEPFRHPAGRLFHYSNVGFAVLGALVEKLRDAPWFDVLHREVLVPLGMTRTTLMPQPPHAQGFAVHPWADLVLPEPATDTGVLGPAGQLWSTPADLSRFAGLLLGDRPDLLAASSLAEMCDPASAAQDPGWNGSYGLGVQLSRADGQRLHGHTGSMPGFVACLWVDAEAGLGAITLANATAGPAVAAIAADLIRTVAEREPRPGPEWQPLASFDPYLLSLTGPWYWGATAFALRLGNDRMLELTSLGSRGRTSRFEPRPDGTWLGLDGYYRGELLRVIPDQNGQPGHLDIGSFVLTRQPYSPAELIPGGLAGQDWQTR